MKTVIAVMLGIVLIWIVSHEMDERAKRKASLNKAWEEFFVATGQARR
jgi:hypothetical protein